VRPASVISALLLCSVALPSLARAEEPVSLLNRTRSQILSAVPRLVNLASIGERKRVTLEVESTFGWGCSCAPFVFTAAKGTAGEMELFVLPVFPGGVLDATKYQDADGPAFVLTGHYSGRIRTIVEYRTERKERMEEGLLEAHPAPELVVESWCYVTKPPGKGKGDKKAPPGLIDRMKKDGAKACEAPR
jgi:hypothetical protein